MSIAAGDLNRRFRIERRAEGTDEFNQPLKGWTQVVDVWASVKGQSGLGSITQPQDGLAASVNAYSVRIRFRRGLDDSMRLRELVDGEPTGDPFDIRNIRMDYANREWTDIVCEQGGTDG